MAAGDASRTWFFEMVEVLRQEWKPEMAWEQVIALRDRLDAMFNELGSLGHPAAHDVVPGLQPADSAGSPSVLVRALVLALGRFGIVAAGEIGSLEKRWAKHHKENGIGLNGQPRLAVSSGLTPQGPDRHAHSPTLR